MSETIVETARILLREGMSEADLLTASAVFQRDFLDGQSGFLRRELLKLDDRSYLDLVHWRDAAAADAVMQAAMASDACRAYFGVMEMGDGDPSGGVSHYHLLAAYPSE